MKSEKHGRSSRFGISEKRWLEIGWRHLLVRASDIECKKEGLGLEQHIGVCGNWKRVKCSGNSVEVQGDVIVVGDERWLYLICCSDTDWLSYLGILRKVQYKRHSFCTQTNKVL